MFKKTIVLLVVFVVLTVLCTPKVYAQDISELEKSVDDMMDSLSPQVREDLIKIGVDTPDLSQINNVSFSSLTKFIADKFAQESSTPLSSGALVMAVLILTSVLENYRDGLRKSSLKEVVSVVSSLCITSTLVFPVINLINFAVATVKDASNFMLLYIPIMIAVLAFSGHAVSQASYYSFMVLVCEGVAQLCSRFISPLLNVYLAFCVSASITDRVNLQGFCSMFSKMIKWMISFTMTVFSALLTIKGLITTAYDSVTTRAVRFTMSSFIPIVGAALSESYKTIQGSVNLMRTGAGVFVILAIFIVFIPTVVRCIAWLFTINLCKSIGETIGVTTPVAMLSSVSSVVSAVFAITVCIMAIFIISTALLITLGGGA